MCMVTREARTNAQMHFACVADGARLNAVVGFVTALDAVSLVVDARRKVLAC